MSTGKTQGYATSYAQAFERTLDADFRDKKSAEVVVIYLQLCAAGLLGMVLGGTVVTALLWFDRWVSRERLVDSGHVTRPPIGPKRR